MKKTLFLQMDINNKTKTNKKEIKDEKKMTDVILYLLDRYI